MRRRSQGGEYTRRSMLTIVTSRSKVIGTKRRKYVRVEDNCDKDRQRNIIEAK